MRWILALLVLATFVAARGWAQDAPPAPKDPVTDAAIIRMCGGPMSRMFELYGAPVDLWADRGSKAELDTVFLGYGPYGFKVRDKVVRTCFFFRGWNGTIRGIRIGDGYEDVRKLHGEPPTTVKAKDGTITAYGYHFPDLDTHFFANFKEGKVWRVEVSLK